jgi:hypothetical protein
VEVKDFVGIGGIVVTFLVSLATLIYSIWNSGRTFFVNTVTASRLKWIDSLRDKVSEFLAVAARLGDPQPMAPERRDALVIERDTLVHQIVLHLNPHDSEDRQIKMLAEGIRDITSGSFAPEKLRQELVHLRDATADYLKKEWNRVKLESGGRRG